MKGGNRVLVIGLDGATFSLIDPWIERGKLPNLATLVREGARGRLRSTIPYVTGPAWTSFATGVNPGKHGIFDFALRRRGEYSIELLNARAIRAKTLWALLSKAGKRIGVLNVPVTYPPQEVNGYLVSGMLTPSLKSEFTYPKSLGGELLSAVPDYDIEPAIVSSDRRRTKRELVKSCFALVRARAKAARFLLHRLGDWDFFMVVFTEPDRLQTYLWDDLDPGHPRHDPESAAEFGEAIPKLYEKLDSIIGEFLQEYVDQRTTLFVLSDHGFAGVHKFFYPNKWLEEEGYLALRAEASTSLRWAKSVLTRVGLAHPAKRFVKALFPDWGFTSQLRNFTFTRDVDWAKTKAFWGADNGFTINLKGRESAGIVAPGREYEALRNELIEKLSALREPETGELVVEKVWKREEIYNGPYTAYSPDLRMVWREYPGQRKTYFSAGELWANETFGYTAQTGDHTPFGILLAYGRAIKGGQSIQGAQLMDLAPTILHLLGLPLPQEMEGKPLEQSLR